MKNRKLQLILLTIITISLLGSLTYTISAQEIGGGAKLVGTSPFVFAEAKFWVLAVEVGAGLSSTETADSNYGNEPSPIDFSLSGKVYPINIMNFSPYLGFSTHYSSTGSYSQSRTFAGAELDLTSQGLPLSAFAGGGLAFTEAKGAGFGWHLGVKYTFSF